jgi:hypothetical protein
MEIILLVIDNDEHFDSTTKQLEVSAFSVNKLKKCNLSVARLKYTTAQELEKYVIEPIVSRNQTAYGVSQALAKDIRHIDYRDMRGTKVGKAICVVDRVEADDHNGHASLGFSKADERVPDTQRRKFRPFVFADLARHFSPLQELSTVYTE